MTILFAQSWDVIPGKFDDYSTFVSNEYNPTLEKLGLRLLGGYYVAVGEGPRIIAVATVEKEEDLMKALTNSEYRIISNRLSQVVFKYSSRVWISVISRLVETGSATRLRSPSVSSTAMKSLIAISISAK